MYTQLGIAIINFFFSFVVSTSCVKNFMELQAEVP